LPSRWRTMLDPLLMNLEQYSYDQC
jgi:hypothetical protein